MFNNPDFKGQFLPLLFSMLLFMLGVSCIINIQPGGNIIAVSGTGRARFVTEWPWWVGYFFASFSLCMFYATFRIIIRRCKQRIAEKTVAKSHAILQFFITLFGIFTFVGVLWAARYPLAILNTYLLY